jgi:methyl-accepting chemotaxis protein
VTLLFTLTFPPIHTIGVGMKRQSVAFKLSKQRLAERDALAADLRERTKALNAAIAAFNQAIEPLSRAVVEAQDDYNAILEKARALASGVTEAARDAFDARSERWQESNTGIKVRSWIEQWEVSLDDIDLEVPEPLTEIDPEEHAYEIEGAPAGPME